MLKNIFTANLPATSRMFAVCAVTLSFLSGSWVINLANAEEPREKVAAIKIMQDSETWKLLNSSWILKFRLTDGMPAFSCLETLTVSGQAGSDFSPSGTEVVLPQNIVMGDKEIKPVWKFESASATPLDIRFTYRSEVPALECVSTWQTLAGYGPIEHSVTITNKGDKPVFFAPPWTVDVNLTVPKSMRLTWVEQPGTAPSAKGTHTETPAKGFSRNLISTPNNSRDAIPWFDIFNPDTPSGIYGGIEFSGLTEILVRDSQEKSGRLRISLGIRQTPAPPKTCVLPGSTYSLPVCFISAYRGEREIGSLQLHRWVLAHLRPATSSPLPGLLLNTWGISGFGINEQTARQCIDDCQSLGIDVFEVDAGWFPEVGDWHPNPKNFPGGMRAISDYAHSKGLRFGLWVAWGIGAGSKKNDANILSVHNPAQKEWFPADYAQDWHAKHPWEGVPLCLGCRDAREWCFRQLCRVVGEYNLDILREDQPMMVENCKRPDHDHLTNETTDVCASAARGYYEVYDRLRKLEPNLLFEGCNGGSNVIDFGFLKRVHYFQVEDRYEPLSNRRSFYDVSHAVPPAMIMQWVGDHLPGQSVANFKYMIRSGMLGICTILQDTRKWNAEKREAAKKLFAVYKKKLRPHIESSTVYRILPRPDGIQWDGIQYQNNNSGSGVLLIFRPDSPDSSQVVLLHGLDKNQSYKITSEDGSIANATYPGDALMKAGLKLTLQEKFSSDTVTIEPE
jgi:hypothetical protein